MINKINLQFPIQINQLKMLNTKLISNGFFLYILECCDSSLYTGITNNLSSRLSKHNEGKGSKYVRSRLPFKLVYLESFEDKSSAMKREYIIKKMKRDEKLKLIG